MSTTGLSKGYILVEGTKEKIVCFFNPSELSISYSASWSNGDTTSGKGDKSQAKGTSLSMPEMRYGGAQNATFSLDLLFDTTDTGKPVTAVTDRLVKLFDISTSLKEKTTGKLGQRPASVKFIMGTFESFAAVVTSLTLNFTYFAPDGTALRAKANLSLTQFNSGGWPAQNPTSGTPHPHRVHRIQRGETLDRIAAEHYGDSTLWRHLAGANGIEDPLALVPGSLLAIPDLAG